MTSESPADPLAAFSEPTRAWFASTFAEPTPPQAQGWQPIVTGDHTLVCAPTGTGKTLAAFLWAIDRLTASVPADARDSADNHLEAPPTPSTPSRLAPRGSRARGTPPRSSPTPSTPPRLASRGSRARGSTVLYVSPLRALAVDVEKNLRAPLLGIRYAAQRLGQAVREPTVGVRTGDTPAAERRRLVRDPPDILITTPESLFLMLTSRARETLGRLQHVIIDEIHAVAGSKRGAHLMTSLERLDELCGHTPQRIALSATQRPLDEIARFLGGYAPDSEGSMRPRPVTVVDAPADKELQVEVVVPVSDMSNMGQVVNAPASAGAAAEPMRRSIWPAIHPRLLELVRSHQSTLIFANARRLAERLAVRLNELHLDETSVDGSRDGARRPLDGLGHGDASAGAEPADGSRDGARLSETAGALQDRPGAASLVALGDEQTGTGAAEGVELVKAHHGSLSRSRRLVIEDELKRGELRGLVSTSTLELGIDMGAVDLVVQIASPGSVASGMQRIGRAGHRVGEPSRGKIFPKHRADLLEAAAVVERMHLGLVEQTRFLRNPLDVAAQQIVAMCSMDDWDVKRLAGLLRRCAAFAELSDEVLHSVLDLLSGVYPSEEFSELRPRIVWDRAAGMIRGRAGAQRLAVTNAGTIPDRGLFGVFLPDGTRVGELDEEMVYEARVGETFLLGASTWRIVEITFERVVVTPAPGQLGKMPFWHGEGPGRPLELGRAVGRLVRELRDTAELDARLDRLRTRHGLDEAAADNLVAYLDDQADATGAVPDDRTVVVERFRDEIGDWRVCLLSPFGTPVHAPWAMAIQKRLSEATGADVETMWSDDGIVMRLPEAVDELALDDLVFDPDEITGLVIERLPETSMFASRFRECAARALLLPRRRPDQRTPLWQQRQRAADLLRVAARYPSFPILLEATRECANDVFDLPGLAEVMSGLRSRRIRMVPADTDRASPFAQSLLFSWIAVYMYEGDAPLAERRAAALSLDRELLRDLLGAEELRELLDADVLANVELELQRLVEGRQARDADEAHDLLRVLGPLGLDDIAARSKLRSAGEADAGEGDAGERGAGEGGAAGIVAGWVRQLTAERRAIEVRLAGRSVVADAADAARLRDAVGVALPPGLPRSSTEPVDDPLGDLCVRYARTHGPFTATDVAGWLGIGASRAAARLTELASGGRLLHGEFSPRGAEREYCDPDVLRRIRRRCLAALRREVEPVEPSALARFLPGWQRVGSKRRGVDALAEAVSQLQGAAVAASVLETDLLAARVRGYRPADLDELCTAGEVVWVGAGPIGASDGRVRLAFRDQARLLLPVPGAAVEGAVHDALRGRLRERGASFWGDLVAAVHAAGLPYDMRTVLTALWDLVWNGEVTNDSLAPVRALTASRGTRFPTSLSTRRPRRSSRPRTTRTSRAARPWRARRRLDGLTAMGPPAAAGRWSLVEPLLRPEPAATEAALTRAHQLLDRYGVVTRQTALGEGQEGGFAGVYPVLKALEERGEVRRGYFVAGLGAAQFALPGAVDRLRAARDFADSRSSHRVKQPAPGSAAGASDLDGGSSPGVVVLAATDPAQPYGAALNWPPSPGRPTRAAGALVVLADGVPLVELGRGGRSLVTFEAAEESDIWISALIGLVEQGRLPKLEIAKVNGVPIAETFWPPRLQSAGFTPGYRGLLYRR